MVWQFDPIKPHNCTMSKPINSYPDSWYVASSPMLAEQPPASGDLAYDVCVLGVVTGIIVCIASSKAVSPLLFLRQSAWAGEPPVGTGARRTGQRADQHSLENGMAKRRLKNCGDLG